MSGYITADPDPETGTVTLTVGTYWDVSEVLRSDLNGTRPVRLPRFFNRKPGFREVVIYDYEAALSGQVQYTLKGDAESPGAWTTLGGTGLPRFILPHSPRAAVVMETVTDYKSSRKTRTTFHEIIGRDDPVPAIGRLTPRTGTLEMWCPEYVHAKNLEALLERGDTVMYRQTEHEGMDMYFHADQVDVEPDGDDWKVSVGYVEVDYPLGGLLTAFGWTFDKLAQRGGTFGTVAQDFRTFLDLAQGEYEVEPEDWA